MRDDQKNPVDGQTDKTPSGPVGGERLAEARREKQISVLDVAKELHLDETKVRALEQNEFDVLGAPVFAKGHLRKYAQLVGVDADDVFADYYQMTRSSGMPPIVVGHKKERRELAPVPWIAAIAALVVVATTYWWLAQRGENTADTLVQDQPDVPEVSAENAQLVDDTVVLAAAQSSDEADPVEADNAAAPAEAGSDRLPAVIESVNEPASPAPADGRIRVSLSFSGDCWTEISDADGRQLFFAMGRNGRTVELSGAPPLSALFGNVTNVSVRVNGAEYAIAATSSNQRTARLQIQSP